MRTYRVNHPTVGKGRSAGSNAKVSARLCSVPCRYTAGIHAFSSVSVQTSCTPATPLYAGVEPAHTRICSTTSCDVFARVVERKPWGETDLTILLCLFTALTCHARFLRLSRVCGRSSKEESLPLFVLFVLFGQAKSTWRLLLLFGQAKSTLCFMYFCMTKSTRSTKQLFQSIFNRMEILQMQHFINNPNSQKYL